MEQLMSRNHGSHPIASEKMSASREQVLTRLWEIASLEPERTRNSMSAQIKALSMIVAIEGLIPDRRAGAANQQSRTERPGVPEPRPGVAAANAKATPSAPQGPVSASAPEIRVPSSTEKKPDTWRLRL
jgi:hypothetical protein